MKLRDFLPELQAVTLHQSLENEEGSGRSAEVDNDQLRAVLEADPPTSMQEVAEELSIDRSMVVQHLKQIGEVMKLC